MKSRLKLSLFVIFTCLIALLSPLFNLSRAQTKTVTVTIAKEDSTSAATKTEQSDQSQETINKLKQIESLKEKIATRVAQIRESEKAGFAGVIKKISANIITLSDRRGEKALTVLEDTVYFTLKKNAKSETSLNKIKEGDLVVFLGYYNETKEDFSTKYVFIQEATNHLIGKIVDIDKSNFTIGVKSKEGQETVDIEKYTSIWNYVKNKGQTKSGFSKLKLSDIVHIYGIPNTEDGNRMSANRIVVIPSLDASISTPSASISPSKAATSAATPKTTR